MLGREPGERALVVFESGRAGLPSYRDFGRLVTLTSAAGSRARPARGFRMTDDVEVPKGTDGYEFLEAAVDGELEADWFPEFRSHFVKSIMGIDPQGAEFWGVFVWNEGSESWEPLPVGVDLFSVKQGHVMGWALVEFDPASPQVPVNTP